MSSFLTNPSCNKALLILQNLHTRHTGMSGNIGESNQKMFVSTFTPITGSCSTLLAIQLRTRVQHYGTCKTTYSHTRNSGCNLLVKSFFSGKIVLF